MVEGPEYSIVWFKRDLRLEDHAALEHAAAAGRVLCLYVIEPSLWAQQDAAAQHYRFVLECLDEVDADLRQHGGRLHVIVGEVPAVLDRLHAQAPFAALYSHQETGNATSFDRDKAVSRWCEQHRVAWHEFAQFGVIRRLESRERWQASWEALVAAPPLPMPRLRFMPMPGEHSRPPPAAELGLDPFDPPLRQRGGRSRGMSMLRSFVDERSATYRGGISSPLSAPTACSRLSPYLASGCLSLREIVHSTRQRLASLPAGPDRRRAGLAAFISRLHWHCHFIQRLESEPEMEFRNLHRGYDGLREQDWNPARFEALMAGRTGWPLVDACVAMLQETGWLNFRMRAMLVSVASFPLWLHWRPVGLWLARRFLDYEPGIHWSQMQMQAGTTGINTARIYNPIKQAQDHDPRGDFVRRWLPAMRRVPDSWLFEPWRMPADVQARCGVKVGEDIAAPLVDLAAATRQARSRLFALRARADVKAARAAIVDRHGSRKRPASPPRRRGPDEGQLTLEF